MQEVQVRFAPLQSNFSSQVSFFELDASLAVITLGSRTDSRRGRFVTRWCSANDGGGTNLSLERSLHKEIFRLSSSPSISAAAPPDISHSFVTWSKEMTDAAASKLQPTSSLPVKLSTAPHQTIMAICYICSTYSLQCATTSSEVLREPEILLGYLTLICATPFSQRLPNLLNT